MDGLSGLSFRVLLSGFDNLEYFINSLHKLIGPQIESYLSELGFFPEDEAMFFYVSEAAFRNFFVNIVVDNVDLALIEDSTNEQLDTHAQEVFDYWTTIEPELARRIIEAHMVLSILAIDTVENFGYNERQANEANAAFDVSTHEQLLEGIV